MKLDEETQQNLRLALKSHRGCFHEDAVLCHALILSELAMRRGYPVTSDEELESCGYFIADVTLEGLILKGLVEVVGVDEEGELLVGLTKDGHTAVEENKLEIEYGDEYDD